MDTNFNTMNFKITGAQQVGIRQTPGTMVQVVGPDGTIKYIFRPHPAAGVTQNFGVNPFLHGPSPSTLVPMGTCDGFPYYVCPQGIFPASFAENIADLDAQGMMTQASMFDFDSQVSTDFGRSFLGSELLEANMFPAVPVNTPATIEFGSIEDFALDQPFGPDFPTMPFEPITEFNPVDPFNGIDAWEFSKQLREAALAPPQEGFELAPPQQGFENLVDVSAFSVDTAGYEADDEGGSPISELTALDSNFPTPRLPVTFP